MKTLVLLIGSILTFIAPIKSLLLIVILIVLLDTSSAIYTSIKLKGRKSYSSGKLFNIIPKISFYSFSILISYLLDYFILGGSLFSIPFLLSKSACMVVLWIEGTSINENFIKLGYKSIDIVITDMIKKIKKIKRDFNEIRE